MAKDENKLEKGHDADNIQNVKNALGEPGTLDKASILAESRSTDLSLRSTSNRVQWLLMELGSLADTLQSLAGELFHPVMLHSNEKNHIKVCLNITF